MQHIRRNPREQGFSLLQIIIALLIISVLSTLATANFLESHKTANETSAVASLRTIFTSNQVFQTRFSAYADSLKALGDKKLVDPVLATGMKAGYMFRYERSGVAWTCAAEPMATGTSGDSYFFIDQSGVVRTNLEKPATKADRPIDGQRTK